MCSALFGGKQSVSTPEIKQVAPSATTITNADIGGTADTEAAKKRKQKQGYAATRLADVAPTNTKSTLG